MKSVKKLRIANHPFHTTVRYKAQNDRDKIITRTKRERTNFICMKNEKKAVSLNSETSISQSQRKLAKQVSIIQRQKKSPVNFNI